LGCFAKSQEFLLIGNGIAVGLDLSFLGLVGGSFRGFK